MLWADISDKSEGRKKNCTWIIEFIIKKPPNPRTLHDTSKEKKEMGGGRGEQKEKKICQEFSHRIQNASVSRDTETS